jgi:hypothetical protein
MLLITTWFMKKRKKKKKKEKREGFSPMILWDIYHLLLISFLCYMIYEM